MAVLILAAVQEQRWNNHLRVSANALAAITELIGHGSFPRSDRALTSATLAPKEKGKKHFAAKILCPQMRLRVA
jgi:hypothetical protein